MLHFLADLPHAEDTLHPRSSQVEQSREQVEGVEGGGRGTEPEERDGGKRPKSSSVLILLSLLPQRLHRSAVS